MCSAIPLRSRPSTERQQPCRLRAGSCCSIRNSRGRYFRSAPPRSPIPSPTPKAMPSISAPCADPTRTTRMAASGLGSEVRCIRRDRHPSLFKDLNAGLLDWIGYEIRDDYGTQTPLRSLDRGHGSCRDVATMLVEAARVLGLGARAVSGYLWDPAQDRYRLRRAGLDPCLGGDLRSWCRVDHLRPHQPCSGRRPSCPRRGGADDRTDRPRHGRFRGRSGRPSRHDGVGYGNRQTRDHLTADGPENPVTGASGLSVAGSAGYPGSRAIASAWPVSCRVTAWRYRRRPSSVRRRHISRRGHAPCPGGNRPPCSAVAGGARAVRAAGRGRRRARPGIIHLASPEGGGGGGAFMPAGGGEGGAVAFCATARRR